MKSPSSVFMCALVTSLIFMPAAPAMSFADTTDRQLADMVQLNQENQSYLAALTILDGRLMAVMGLYRAGQIDDARIQIEMALNMSQELADDISNHGGMDNGFLLEQMRETILARGNLDRLAEQYAEWRNGLLGSRFQTPYSLGTQLRAVSDAVTKATDLYQGALSPDGNKIIQTANYQTAFGIIQAARQVILLYIGEATTEDQRTVFENISSELSALDILLPNLVMPQHLHTDGDGFKAIADRITMKAMTLR